MRLIKRFNFAGLLILLLMFLPVYAAKPKVAISASPASIVVGGSSTLTWTSTGATSASINQGIGSVPGNGSIVVMPTATKTYTITVKNSSGTTTAKATVTVKAAPPTVTFSAAPATIQPGQSSTLSWTTGNATSAAINQGIGTVALSGTKNISPTATKTYTITVKGAGGTVTAQATVTVQAAPPVATFSAEPATILLGESATLTWTSANATSVFIDNGIGSVALNGSRDVSPGQTTAYTLTATGTGGTATAQVQVQVNIAPTATLTVTPQVIHPGENAILSWTTANADTAVIDNGIGSVEENGSLTLSPAATITYILSVTGPGGTSSASATVIISNGRKCYAYIPDSLDDNIRVIDTDTLTLFKTIGITDSLTELKGMAVDPAGVYAYAANAGSNYIKSIDPLTMSVTGSQSVQGRPKHMAVAPDGRFLYLTSGVFLWDPQDGKYVGLIFTLNGGETIRLDTPRLNSLEGLVVSPDNSRLYVANPDSRQIVVLETAKLQRYYVQTKPITDELIATIQLDSQALELAVSPDGQRLYAATKNSLIIIDALNFSVIKSITVGNIYDSVCFIEVHPDGGKVYIMSESGKLSIMETINNTLIASEINNGWGPCTGFDIHPDGNRLYTIDKLSKKLLMIDASSYHVISSTPLGSSPMSYGNFIGYFPITISGNVQQDNLGLSGVTLTLDGEGIKRTKQTGTAGDFIFGLKAGNYQLTPTLSNLAFSPESMDLHVDENKIGLDFVVSGIVQPPTVTLATSSTWVKSYESFVLTWTSTGADYVRIEMATSDHLPPNGSRAMTLSTTSTISAVAYNRGGTASASVKVYVSSTTPPTASISANPASILQGSSSILTWTTTKASTITIDNGIGTVAATGSRTVTPASTTSYTITATGSQSYQVTASATVVVVPAPIPTITLTATPEMLLPGGSSTLTWASSNATSVTIDNGIGAVDLSGTRIVSPSQDTTYTAVATGPSGTAMATIMVKMLDTHLRSIWGGMKTAMINQNIDSAISNFAEEAQLKYREIYSDLQQLLPQIATGMQEIELVETFDGGAQYRLLRHETHQGVEYDITYYVYFVREEEGTWKILKF